VDKWEKYESKGKTEKLLPAQQTHYRVDLEWLDANRNFRLEKHSPLPGHTSYYLHSCPDGALNVQSYQELILQNLYEGINLHYYQQHGELKHDYIVSAGADYRKIALRIKGAKVALQDDGSLLLKTPLGDIQE